MSNNNEKQIGLVSNPSKVFQNARKIYGNNVKIDISDRKNKKYMIFDPHKKKYIHFGDIKYSDFTKTQDDEKRRLFRLRNHKWQDSPMYSASHMSYWILW
jgi:hypothetical protein|tara:strand:+ start:207 stop:506 length:300 start_codon:yes stop_codon:yes gene_type:complete